MKNTVTQEMVDANMKDYKCTTINLLGKPTTFVQVRMKNGFILNDSTTCVDPDNYNEEIGKNILLKRMETKVWELLGFELTSHLNGTALIEDSETVIKKTNCLDVTGDEEPELIKKLEDSTRLKGFVNECGGSSYDNSVRKYSMQL